jgi:hypothetical protein
MHLWIPLKKTPEVTHMNRKYQIELEQETDGRWIAEIEALSGAMVYGNTREQSIMNIEILALRILADRWLSLITAYAILR